MQRWVAEVPGLDRVADLPGAGAAGGLGAALLWLGGRREAGAGLVAQAIGLDAGGCGRPTSSSPARGRTTRPPCGARWSARLRPLRRRRRCRAWSWRDRCEVGRREAAAHGIDEMLSLADLAGSIDAATTDADRWLSAAAAKLASAY